MALLYMTNQNDTENTEYNRREFLKGGSVAALMTMLGGIELVAQTNATLKTVDPTEPTTVAVIGLGTWGKEIINNLARMDVAIIAGICDSYEAILNRIGKDHPKVFKTTNYQEILSKPEIK